MGGKTHLIRETMRQLEDIDLGYRVRALGHRIVLRPEYEIEGVTITEVIGKILEQVAVPR